MNNTNKTNKTNKTNNENNIDYAKINSDVWNNINECLVDKATAVSHEDYIKAQNGELKVTLAGVQIVPKEWFPELKDKKVLGLASGGGQQCPIFAAHGANVTVMDLTDRQLENERYVSEREGYSINIVKADMSKPFPFEDNTFDMIFNPISNCYIQDILPMWRECARVIKKGGVLMMAFIKEENFMFDPDYKTERVLISRHRLPFNPLTDYTQEQLEARLNNHMPLAFSHTITEQIGGLLDNGFEITNIFEDCDGGGLHDYYMNAYIAVRAIKK